jgi:hypothetical protein
MTLDAEAAMNICRQSAWPAVRSTWKGDSTAFANSIAA